MWICKCFHCLGMPHFASPHLAMPGLGQGSGPGVWARGLGQGSGPGLKVNTTRNSQPGEGNPLRLLIVNSLIRHQQFTIPSQRQQAP
jgi:hypothetical protein